MEEADKEGLGNITYNDFLKLCKPSHHLRFLILYTQFISLFINFLLLMLRLSNISQLLTRKLPQTVSAFPYSSARLTMKAIVQSEFGGPETLKVGDAPMPVRFSNEEESFGGRDTS